MKLARDLYLAYSRYMVDEKGWRAQTRRVRIGTLKLFAEFCAIHGESVLTADRKLVLAFIGRTKHPRTRNHNLCNLRGFYTFAVRDGYRKDDPTTSIDRVREPRSLPRPLKVQDAERLLFHAKALSPRAEAVVAILLYSGLRREEASKLTWSDVDLDNAVVRVTDGKGGKDRYVPIPPQLVEILLAWRYQSEGNHWVFPSERRPSEHLNNDIVWRDVVAAGRAAGLPGVHPHQLRHTFLTELYGLLKDIRAVQDVAGHASAVSTQIYTKVYTGDVAAKMKRFSYAKGRP